LELHITVEYTRLHIALHSVKYGVQNKDENKSRHIKCVTL